MELNWGIITFIMGTIMATIGGVWKYFEGRCNLLKVCLTEREKEQNELQLRIEKIEMCNADIKVDIAKINKDVEYIRLEITRLATNIEKYFK